MDASSPRKLLKIYNLTTRNAVKMKFTSIVYHHKTFHLTKDLGVTHQVWEGVVKKPSKKKSKNQFSGFFSWNFQHYIKNRNICHTLPCTPSLLKVLYKSDLV